MRMNALFLVVVALSGAALLVGFWGCGTGPIEQSYAIQSGAEGVNGRIGDKTEIPNLMKRLRTSNLNLVDRLTAGTPDQVVRAAVDVSIISRDIGKYQPAIARTSLEEAATYKRLANDVQDMSVEVAKAADGGHMPEADNFYVRLFLSCNSCHRLYRGVMAPTSPMEIPELETPKGSEKPKDTGTAPIPTPTPGPTPAPEPAPAPPAN